jgi:hypothetical protein
MPSPRLTVSRSLVPSFSVVEHEDERNRYRQKLLAHWKARGTFFPGCNPVSVSRSGLEVLHQHNYLISLKSDGVRYVLFCTTRPDGSGAALLIDRAWNMYEIEVVAPEDFFLKETILEGELVWEQPKEERMVYLVFDGILIKGESLLLYPFEERLRRTQFVVRLSEELLHQENLEEAALEANAIVFTHYDPCIICRPKRFVGLKHASRLWSERSEADHRVDGVVACRCEDPYVKGSALGGCMFKWKEFATVDLQGNNKLRLSDAPLPATFEALQIRLCASGVKATSHDVIAEYLITVDAKFVNLFALRLRPDKSEANTLRVFELTVKDVIEQISIEELCPVSMHTEEESGSGS